MLSGSWRVRSSQYEAEIFSVERRFRAVGSKDCHHPKARLDRQIGEAGLCVPVQHPRAFQHLADAAVDDLVAKRGDLTTNGIVTFGRCGDHSKDAAPFIDVFPDYAELCSADAATNAGITAGLRDPRLRFAELFDQTWESDPTFRERWKPRKTKLRQIFSGRYLDERLHAAPHEAGIKIARQLSEHGGHWDFLDATRYKPPERWPLVETLRSLRTRQRIGLPSLGSARTTRATATVRVPTALPN